MIRLDRVRYVYPGARAAALDGVSLTIADGDFVVIAGDSGSGKSTLARAMVGLVPHFHGGTFAGTATIGALDTREHPPRDLAGVIGFVSQDPESQSVANTVTDEIAFAMENLGVEPAVMRKRLEEVLDALAIATLRERSLDTLSGGERQRVAIAAVLAAQPRALVLDEPTSQLDPQSAEDVLGVLHRLNADLGLTVVVVEHRLERVAQHADRLIVMACGRVIADGAPRAVLRDVPIGPPLAHLARALAWEPFPLTVREGRTFAARTTTVPRDPMITTPGAPLIEARGLRVARGARDVLRGVDLTVRAGETVAVIGRNGSGKTTLLRTLVGLLKPYAGARTICGLDPATTPIEQIARHAAYVPQSVDSILFCDTVREEVAFTLKGRDVDGNVDLILEREGIAATAGEDPRDLSAGERLRTAIVAATAGAPAVVLFDEPTRGMDAAGKEWLARTLDDRARAGGATVIVTHDVELAARVATRVVLLAEGTVVVDGPVHDVLGESALFASQMTKVFGDRRILTLEHALAAVR